MNRTQPDIPAMAFHTTSLPEQAGRRSTANHLLTNISLARLRAGHFQARDIEPKLVNYTWHRNPTPALPVPAAACRLSPIAG
ncbi:MAG TPA: hypothetical protein VH593_15135, partial [Ktedonobacteraceae bacterium]